MFFVLKKNWKKLFRPKKIIFLKIFSFFFVGDFFFVGENLIFLSAKNLKKKNFLSGIFFLCWSIVFF